jgi:hypothetical protein
MAGLQELRSQAKALGIPSSLIRANMNDADKLADLIAGFQKGHEHALSAKAKTSNKGGTKVAKPVARAKAKAKAKVAKVAKVTRSTSKRRTSVATSKRTVNKRTSTPRKAVSKRTTSKAAPKRSTRGSDKAGRHTIDRVNFSNTDGWNPREGSAVEEIWMALKKAKGDREKAFQTLKSRVWDFVGKTKADGSKRPKSEEPGGAYHMLRYRISRTLFDFAVATGQHESSKNRIEYGTGPHAGNGRKSKPKARQAVKKATAKPAAIKRGRGRPKGSTNKPKAATTRTRRKARR